MKENDSSVSEHLRFESALGADHGVRNVVAMGPGNFRYATVITCGPKLKLSIFTATALDVGLRILVSGFTFDHNE